MEINLCNSFLPCFPLSNLWALHARLLLHESAVRPLEEELPRCSSDNVTTRCDPLISSSQWDWLHYWTDYVIGACAGVSCIQRPCDIAFASRAVLLMLSLGVLLLLLSLSALVSRTCCPPISVSCPGMIVNILLMKRQIPCLQVVWSSLNQFNRWNAFKG